MRLTFSGEIECAEGLEWCGRRDCQTSEEMREINAMSSSRESLAGRELREVWTMTRAKAGGSASGDEHRLLFPNRRMRHNQHKLPLLRLLLLVWYPKKS